MQSTTGMEFANGFVYIVKVYQQPFVKCVRCVGSSVECRVNGIC